MEVARKLEDRWLRPHGRTLPPGNYQNFGHKTFLQAERYRHHVNKDPSKSYGGIVLSVWNPHMHRVEVMVRHDRERAKELGAYDIIQDLDDGKPRQISMGCRVPFDVCTVCGHVSRTPRDYCGHLKTRMGSINSDGSITGAVNFFPRFFDLSDVFVPAAKESGVLMKVAHILSQTPGEKRAAKMKRADIDKRILPNTGKPDVNDISKCEPDLPKHLLTRGDMGDLVSTLSALGIVMKPHEFQRASLHRMGLGRYSDELDQRRMVFAPMRGERGFDLDPSRFRSGLAEMLSNVLSARSAFRPHLPRRVVRITVMGLRPNAPRAEAPDSEPLRKIAQAYDSYRNSLRHLPNFLDIAVRENPHYYSENFFSELLTDSMEKAASSGFGTGLSTASVPLYLYTAYRDSDEASASWDLPISRTSPARALIAPTL